MHEHELPATGDKLEEEVRERVEELKGFYIHTGIYILINFMLIVLNFLTTPGYFWAIWPLLGWGIGIGAHAISIFGLFGVGGQAWGERKVRELMLQRQRGLNANQVRQLMQEEMHSGPQRYTTASDLERMLRRLENLEAIVTSQAWDQIEEESLMSPPGHPELSIEEPEEPPDEQAARISRRVQ